MKRCYNCHHCWLLPLLIDEQIYFFLLIHCRKKTQNILTWNHFKLAESIKPQQLKKKNCQPRKIVEHRCVKITTSSCHGHWLFLTLPKGESIGDQHWWCWWQATAKWQIFLTSDKMREQSLSLGKDISSPIQYRTPPCLALMLDTSDGHHQYFQAVRVLD